MATVDLEIRASTKEAQKALNDFAKQASSSLGGIEKGFGALKAVGAAAVAFFAGREVIGFFKDGVEAAIAQEQALAKLSKQLELSGQLTDGAVASFSNFADQLERTTKFEDDQILSASALAATFGQTTEKTQELVKAAVELTALRPELDLNSAVDQLGKTLTGTSGKLQGLIPGFDSLSKAQLRAGGAAKFIIGQYGGSAAAEIQTFQGAVQQTAKAFGNFQESFGSIFIENAAVVETIKAVADGFFRLEEFVKSNSDTIDIYVSKTVRALVQGAGFAASGIGVLTDAMNIAQKVTAALIELQIRLQTTFLKFSPLRFINVFREYMESADDIIKDVRELSGSLDSALDTGSKGADAAAQAILDLSYRLENLSVADNKSVKSAKAAASARKGFSDSLGQTAEEVKKLAAEASKFESELTKATADEFGKLTLARNAQLEDIKRFESERAISAENGAKLRLAVETKYTEDTAALKERQAKDSADVLRQTVEDFENSKKKEYDATRKAVQEGLDSPFSLVFGEDQSRALERSLGAVTGVVDKMLKGAEGATDLISETFGYVAEYFLPGIGSTVAGIVQVLAGGPEKVKQLVNGFVRALPDVIKAIADALPVLVNEIVKNLPRILDGLIKGAIYFVETIVANLPQIIQGFIDQIPNIIAVLVDKMPDLIAALAKAAPDIVLALVEAIPQVAIALGQAIADEAGAIGANLGENIFRGFVDAIASFGEELKKIGGEIAKGFRDGVDQSTGGIGGKASSGFKKVFGLAEGGIVPPGFNNDNFPARLTSGEMVIPRDDVQRLKSFLDRSESMSQAPAQASGSQNLTINLKVGEKQLADVLLNLNRQGFRVA